MEYVIYTYTRYNPWVKVGLVIPETNKTTLNLKTMSTKRFALSKYTYSAISFEDIWKRHKFLQEYRYVTSKTFFQEIEKGEDLFGKFLALVEKLWYNYLRKRGKEYE